MRTVTALAAGALAATLGFAVSRVLASPEDAPPAPATAGSGVCTVNIGKVFRALPQARKLEEDLGRQMDQIKASLGEREQELKKAAQDIEARLSPGTPAYEAERKKIEMRIMELQYDGKSEVETLRR
ncbi:MAG: OmpH family outer membrane protein, partial [Planctomycetes bacterium]|nr:OmpH family outer membrane protein [Planctomycetota bacterium]